MAKLHHTTLKSAVAKYQQYHIDGQTDEQVKALIAADEKAFNEEAVNEIYEAIVDTPSNSNSKSGDSKKTFIVISAFRDKGNFNLEHKEGADVSHFEEERLKVLISNGHVEIR